MLVMSRDKLAFSKHKALSCVLQTKANNGYVSSRNLRYIFGLYFLDTSLLSNENIIASIQKEIFHSKTLEAFLESAPQFILQSSIIWRTGNLSKHNLLNRTQIIII
jgi:hypothetical protein